METKFLNFDCLNAGAFPAGLYNTSHFEGIIEYLYNTGNHRDGVLCGQVELDPINPNKVYKGEPDPYLFKILEYGSLVYSGVIFIYERDGNLVFELDYFID